MDASALRDMCEPIEVDTIEEAEAQLGVMRAELLSRSAATNTGLEERATAAETAAAEAKAELETMHKHVAAVTALYDKDVSCGRKFNSSKKTWAVQAPRISRTLYSCRK